MTSIDDFLCVADEFCRQTGLAESTLSTRVLADGKRITAIRRGADIGSRRLSVAMAWLVRHWPEGADWPEGISKPCNELVTPPEVA